MKAKFSTRVTFGGGRLKMEHISRPLDYSVCVTCCEPIRQR